MKTPDKSLLCVDASPSQRAICARMAEFSGLRFVGCEGELAFEQAMQAEGALALAVIGHTIQEGDSLRVIEAIRLNPSTAMLPIAFLVSTHNLNLSRNALRRGATEVFLRSEQDDLHRFITHCTSDIATPSYLGKVLLIEDSNSHAQYVTELCRTLGLAVDRVSNAEDGFNAFQRDRYTLVIVDVVLSGTKTGVSLVKQLRMDHERHQPVLVMSGFDDLPRRLMALRSGADDFLSKPFSPEEFVWRVHKLMQLQAHIDLEPAPHEVIKDGKSERKLSGTLTPRESEVFELILQGKSDKEIAAAQGISFWTVRSHIQQIFTKTGALNRRELMARFSNRDQ